MPTVGLSKYFDICQVMEKDEIGCFDALENAQSVAYVYLYSLILV